MHPNHRHQPPPTCNSFARMSSTQRNTLIRRGKFAASIAYPRATFALHAGRNIRWVADQLRHADPALTLRVYAHAMRNEETDLSFAEFGDPKRPYTAPRNETDLEEVANYLKTMARREGFACSLRSLVESEAVGTLTIGWCLRGLDNWRAGRDSNLRPSGSKPDSGGLKRHRKSRTSDT
jgi:hypothetical protein